MVYHGSARKSFRQLTTQLGSTLQDGLLQALLPCRCVACGAAGDLRLPLVEGTAPVRLDLCRACFDLLPFNDCACQQCGIPLNGVGDSDLICGQCQRRPLRFARACCALRYEYPADQLLRALKFGQRVSHARVMAALLARQLLHHHAAWPECIVPVPLHVGRFQQRGYNQVLEIGTQLSRLLAIPLRTDIIQRTRATREQSGLSRRERLRNLRDAFTVTEASLPARIAVLDDVMTTGSTLSEISRILLKRARQTQQMLTIDAWSVARVALRTR